MKVDPHYIDISPLISERIAVFPGDTPFKRKPLLNIDEGDHIGLSSIETTVHLGAHADAPSHYGASEDGIAKVDLSPYFGLAQVIKVELKPGERIRPTHISQKKIEAKRILFCTSSFTDPDVWTPSFNSLSPELISELHSKNVILVGIDTPSVDPAESKTLESHQMLLKTQMRVLEGLVLSHVKEGIYQLIALPLSIENSDASPVRAILLPPHADLAQH